MRLPDYATGRLTNALGWVIRHDRLWEGEVGDESIFRDGPILKDAQTAEIHQEQLSWYGGGCETFHLPGGCADVQSSIHLP